MNMTAQPQALPAGSVVRPSIYFGPDKRSGFYRAGQDAIGVTINGVNIATIDSNGLAVTGAFSVDGALSGTQVSSTGGIKSSSPTDGIGYVAGAGGSVSQMTDRSTGVTVNAVCGTVTGQATSLAAGAVASFIVTNSAVGVRDVVNIAVSSGTTANTSMIYVSAVSAGSFQITVRNLSADTADVGAPIINFAVIKAANA